MKIQANIFKDQHELANLTAEEAVVLGILAGAMAYDATVKFTYDEKPREVRVCAVGISTAGKPCFRAYQTGGEASRPLPGWSLFSLGKVPMQEIELEMPMDGIDLDPPEGYQMDDKQMKYIFIQGVV